MQMARSWAAPRTTNRTAATAASYAMRATRCGASCGRRRDATTAASTVAVVALRQAARRHRRLLASKAPVWVIFSLQLATTPQKKVGANAIHVPAVARTKNM